MRNIPQDISVPYGTELVKVKEKLPKWMTLIDSKNNEHILNIEWSIVNSYNPKEPRAYEAKAKVKLPEGVEQNTGSPVALEYSIKITVEEKIVPKINLSVDFDFTGHVGIPKLVAIGEDEQEYEFIKDGDSFSVEVNEGEYTVIAKNISEGWVALPPELKMNKENLTGIMSLQKGKKLNIKVQTQDGEEVEGAEIKSEVSTMDLSTWQIETYEYGAIIPSGLPDDDEIKISIKAPEGYDIVGEREKIITFGESDNEIIFTVEKAKDPIEVEVSAGKLYIKINGASTKTNFVIRDKKNKLIYVGIVEDSSGKMIILIQDEEKGEYRIFANINGEVKMKEFELK